ncbi:MAG: hypothetical protein ACRDA3_05665, partial [Peptostreptococcaceae bacterium]
VKHEGLEKTTLTNTSRKPLKWEARFYGDHDYINVNGKRTKAKQKEINGVLVSYAKVNVKKGETVVANVMK